MFGISIKLLKDKGLDSSIKFYQNKILNDYNIKIDIIQYYFEDIKELRESKNNSITYIHMPFTIKVDILPKYIHTAKNSILNIFKLDREVKGIVIHLPNNTVDYIANFVIKLQNKLASVLEKDVIPLNIFWEHSVYTSVRSDCYFKYNEIKSLMNKLKSIDGSLFNHCLCLDTCHAYSMGVPLSTKEDIDNYFKPLIRLKDKLQFRILVHLNDSKFGFNSGKDFHAPIGTNIWKDYDGYKRLIYLCRKNDIDYIFEPSQSTFDNSLDQNMLNII